MLSYMRRQVAAKIPGLNSALGLSSGGESKTYYGRSGQNNLSIHLKSRNRKKIRTRSRNGPLPFGMTSRATAATIDGMSENDSQEEIFPRGNDQARAITVTTEVEHHVESNAESAKSYTLFTDGLPQENEEPRKSPERSGHISPNNKSSRDTWLRRSNSKNR